MQEAVNIGATVAGVAGGPDKTARVRALGANVAVDSTEPGWPDAVRDALGGREVTVALDGVGGDIGRDAMGLLGAGGRLLLFGGSSGDWTRVGVDDLYANGITVSVAIGPQTTMRPGGVRRLEEEALAAAASGRLVPIVGQRFPLARAADAHLAIESRSTVGKTVLVRTSERTGAGREVAETAIQASVP